MPDSLHPILTGIRWVVFDAVGTLVYPEPSVSQVYHAAAVRYGSQLSREEIRERFLRVFEEMEAAELSSSSLGEEEHAESSSKTSLLSNEEREVERWRGIVSQVLTDLPEDVREPCFRELFDHFATAAAWRCFPDVAETLEGLNAAGFQLGIASNFDHRLHALCDDMPELRLLSLRVISSEIGYRKPAVEFYRTLESLIGERREAILMIGDDDRNDIEGATAAGLRVIKVDRGETHRAGELKSLRELIGK